MTAPGLTLSVVIPVYGCADCLETLRARLATAMERHRISYEIVFVDDASRDAAASVLARLAAGSPQVRVISLQENRGQPAAIAAGLALAAGQWCAVMDCDLQDPPELLPEMLTTVVERADILVTRRLRHSQVWWRRVASSTFGPVARRRQNSTLIGRYSVFSVISRRAVIGYLQRAEREVVYLPVLERLGLPIVSFDYARAGRHTGRSSYTTLALARRAIRVLLAPGARKN